MWGGMREVDGVRVPSLRAHLSFGGFRLWRLYSCVWKKSEAMVRLFSLIII